MFRSGFAEGIRLEGPCGDGCKSSERITNTGDVDMHSSDEDDVSNTPGPFPRFQDSDDEDDEDEEDEDAREFILPFDLYVRTGLFEGEVGIPELE